MSLLLRVSECGLTPSACPVFPVSLACLLLGDAHRLDTLSHNVSEICHVIHEVLSSDEDMAEMYLTVKASTGCA